MKKIKKVLSVVNCSLIKKIYFFKPSAYKKLYVKHLRKLGVQIVGIPNFIAHSVIFDGSDYSLIKIGDKVTISANVLLLTHDRSPMVGYRAVGQDARGVKLDEIHIGNNSFIGARAILLQGTYIGENSIVGAGAVVKGKFPDDVIIAGNPARVVANTLEWHNRKSRNPEELEKITFNKKEDFN